MPTGVYVPPPPCVAANATVEANTADATLTAANAGKIQTNTGASGAVVLTLPAVATVAGLAFKIQVTVAQVMQFKPATGEKVFLGGSGVASKYVQIAGVIGNFIEIFSDGVQYHVTNYSGVATKEA